MIGTTEIGDANVILNRTTNWCTDLQATNALGVAGPVQTYARLGAGLILFNGLDMDDMSTGFDPNSTSGRVQLNRIWMLQLLQPFNPDGLPCSVVTPPGADLAISVADAPDPVGVGQDLTYAITVSNAGPSTATHVIVSIPLPANVTPVSQSFPGQCPPGNPIRCEASDLGPGASAQYTVVIRPQATGTLSITWSVSANQADPNAANNSASTTTTVSTPNACSPRPPVRLSVTPSGPGRLQVSITPGYGTLQQLRFLAAPTGRVPVPNALIDVAGQTGRTGNFDISLGGVSSYTFFIRRQTPGQATTVPLVVVDGCGDWQTMAGGGPGAF